LRHRFAPEEVIAATKLTAGRGEIKTQQNLYACGTTFYVVRARSSYYRSSNSSEDIRNGDRFRFADLAGSGWSIPPISRAASRTKPTSPFTRVWRDRRNFPGTSTVGIGSPGRCSPRSTNPRPEMKSCLPATPRRTDPLLPLRAGPMRSPPSALPSSATSERGGGRHATVRCADFARSGRRL